MPSWIRGTPGYSPGNLLDSCSEEQLEELLGTTLSDALRSFDIPITGQSVAPFLKDLGEWRRLLLAPTPRRQLLSNLPVVKAEELIHRLGFTPERDPFVTLEATLDSLTPEQEGKLLQFFGIAARDKPTVAAAWAKDVSHRIEPRFGLFEHQRLTAEATREALSQSRSVLLHMPTGSGKTRTAMHLISEHLRARERALVFWLSEQPEVLNQGADAFIQAWSNLGDRPLEVHRLYGAATFDADSVRDGFVVGGFQKLHALSQRDENALLRLGDRTTLVVADEAHQAIAPTYNSVLRGLSRKKPDTRLLGLTATPGRSWLDVEEDLRLSAFFDSKKVTLVTPDDRGPIKFLTQEGYLAKPTFRHVELSTRPPTDTDLDGGGFNFINQSRLLLETVGVMERHLRIIVFAASVPHARLLASVLRSRGHDCEVITAETPKAERDVAYQRFRNPSPRAMALINFGVLTTGFDAPAASAAIIARPTRSLVLFSQMVGRVLRGPRANGTEHAEIVTTVDTALPGFGSVAEAFNNWEDVWND